MEKWKKNVFRFNRERGKGDLIRKEVPANKKWRTARHPVKHFLQIKNKEKANTRKWKGAIGGKEGPGT